jgi:hypothetical protein
MISDNYCHVKTVSDTSPVEEVCEDVRMLHGLSAILKTGTSFDQSYMHTLAVQADYDYFCHQIHVPGSSVLTVDNDPWPYALHKRARKLLIQPRCTQEWLDDIEPGGSSTLKYTGESLCPTPLMRMEVGMLMYKEMRVAREFVEWLDSGEWADPRLRKVHVNPFEYCAVKNCYEQCDASCNSRGRDYREIPQTNSVAGSQIFAQWRSNYKHHLLNLELVEGKKLVYKDPFHIDRRNENLTGTAARIEPIERLWELSNDHIDWQRFIEIDEGRISELRSSNDELINQLATTSIDFRSVPNIRARSKLEDTINEQASEIEFLTTLVRASKQRLYEVSSAREIFDTYFNKSHDEAELQIKDTFMVLNIVINQRLNDTSFQRVEVLSVTELEKASNLLIQIECENLCKTEAALAAFHDSNLRHLQPDLRPDKYPEEL